MRAVRIAVPLLVLAAALPAGAALVPPQVPDRLPLASESLRRAALLTAPAPDGEVVRKKVDGLVDDWVGAPTHLGGTTRYDRGELVHTDHLFDDWGADDGEDAERLAALEPVYAAEERTRRVDQLFQAAGDQFDAPRPVGTSDHYGDGTRGQGDLRELRWAADAAHVSLLARTTTLTDAAKLGVLVLVDRDGTGARKQVAGFSTALFDAATLLTASGATGLPSAKVAVRPDGWDNALEASLPASFVPQGSRVAVVTGEVAPDGAFTPSNVAYRSAEPVAGVYNEQAQALALLRKDVDAFAVPLDVDGLRRGRSETARPGPGYLERQVRSREDMSRESGENGVWQPYGLYVPTSYRPGTQSPLTMWLHYRGGKAHSGGAWTPRLITQLGEEKGTIVATPRGRGTSTWYVTEAHQDFFEVFGDVQRLLDVDPGRRYLAGYSMGGYGTYLFGLLYPDLFAGGFSSSGAMTQGAWTGEGPDGCRAPCYVEANGGSADAQNTFRLLPNAKHVPLVVHHGTNDELVPVTGITRIAARLTELGYRHEVQLFEGYEHFTQAIVDEWADGVDRLYSRSRVVDPRDVTYQVVPALVKAVNTVTADGVAYDFRPDGAYWVDGLQVRRGADGSDTSVVGRLDATSEMLGGRSTTPLPRTGAVSPGAHSTPYVRTGLDLLEGPALPLRNAFSATLTNLAAATLDADRMALDTGRRVTGAVVSDGPATLRLTGVTRPVAVTVGGVAVPGAWSDGVVTVPVGAGTSAVVLQPV